ncbi:hypothetical protein Tco_1173321 [Tanacetum coccineum]
MQEVVKKEIVKLLDTGIIYPIIDIPWVSLIYCVPKKCGITVVTNEKDELVPTRTVMGWRVCIDYHKLNEATAKDHFPLPSWIKFDIEIKDKKGTENVVADHLYRIENDETIDDGDDDENFPGETLMEITTRDIPCLARWKVVGVLEGHDKWGDKEVTMKYLELKGGVEVLVSRLVMFIELLGCLLKVLISQGNMLRVLGSHGHSLGQIDKSPPVRRALSSRLKLRHLRKVQVRRKDSDISSGIGLHVPKYTQLLAESSNEL